jgi:hypothetical protein
VRDGFHTLNIHYAVRRVSREDFISIEVHKSVENTELSSTPTTVSNV